MTACLQRTSFIRWLIPALFLIIFLVLSGCRRESGTQARHHSRSNVASLNAALASVDTVGNMLVAARMSEKSGTEAPLGFRLGSTHLQFMQRMQEIAHAGLGRIDDDHLVYFTDHRTVPSDLVVSDRSLFNIGISTPDTLTVSKIEYAYRLQQTDSLWVINVINRLMDATTNGTFKASPVIAMPGHFEQLWTRDNLVVKVSFNPSASMLYFYAFDASKLSREDLLGTIATFKAGAAKCHISLGDLKQEVQAYLRKRHKDYEGLGGWKVDWYTTEIVVRHKYKFPVQEGRNALPNYIVRNSMFHFNYSLKNISEFVLHEHSIE